jgi:hypothetical protein
MIQDLRRFHSTPPSVSMSPPQSPFPSFRKQCRDCRSRHHHYFVLAAPNHGVVTVTIRIVTQSRVHKSTEPRFCTLFLPITKLFFFSHSLPLSLPLLLIVFQSFPVLNFPSFLFSVIPPLLLWVAHRTHSLFSRSPISLLPRCFRCSGIICHSKD